MTKKKRWFQWREVSMSRPNKDNIKPRSNRQRVPSRAAILWGVVLGCSLLLASFFAGCGGPALQQSLVADPGITTRYPEVVQVIASRSSSSRRSSAGVACTGTVVSTRSVLTASHCIPGDASQGSMNRTVKVRYEKRTIDVAKVRVLSPGLVDKLNPNDVALLIFDDDVFSPEHVRPILTQVWDGMELTFVGYGSDRFNKPGKRAGSNILAEHDSQLLRFYSVMSPAASRSPQPNQSRGAVIRLAGPANQVSICKGDSGGPAFYAKTLEGPAIVGIHHVRSERSDGTVCSVLINLSRPAVLNSLSQLSQQYHLGIKFIAPLR